MQCDGSPMSVCSVLRRREQLLGIFIDLCSISSTWSPLLLLLELLLLLLFLAQLLFVCPEQSHKTASVSIGLDFICAPFCRHLNELHLPAWLCPNGNGLSPNAHSSQQEQLKLPGGIAGKSVQIIKMLSHISVLRYELMLSQSAAGFSQSANLPFDVINYKQNVPSLLGRSSSWFVYLCNIIHNQSTLCPLPGDCHMASVFLCKNIGKTDG